MKIDRTPPYQQIAAHLRERIVSGELTDGDHFPSVSEMRKTWKISPVTAAKVISTLQAEGLVEPRVGTGTVVTTSGLNRRTRDRFEGTAETGDVYTPGDSAEISVEILPAPDHVADTLGLERGASVIRRKHITRAADGRPQSMSVSWHHAENVIGRCNVTGTDRLSAPLAADTEDELLGLEQPVASN